MFTAFFLACLSLTFRMLRWDQPLLLEIEADGCVRTKNEIRYLEHVQLVLTIDYARRGDLTVFLTTPMGTRSCLLPVRGEDSSDEGFHKWTFMTTHAWGEDPRGNWVLEIKDGGESRRNTGYLKDWQLILHGTKTKPDHQNITHPDIPIHQKAIPDDVKKVEKSSVQITQITYTFGNQGASQTYIPSPSEPQTPYTPSTLVPETPITPQYPVLQNTAQINPMNFAQGFNNYNSNNNIYSNPYARTNVPPAYSGSNYANMYTNQQQPGVYGQNMVPMTAQVPTSYNDPVASNLWDFFGRVSGKRSVEEEEEEKEEEFKEEVVEFAEQPQMTRSRNTLTEILQKLNQKAYENDEETI